MTQRRADLVAVLVGGALLATLGGCYNVNVANRGFTCQVTDQPACPEGFRCVNGYCESGSGVVQSQADASMPDASASGDDGGGVLDLARPSKSHDFAMSSPDDLSQPTMTTDLAMSTMPDFSTGPEAGSCVPTGGDCTYHKDAICCSKYCIYATNTCR